MSTVTPVGALGLTFSSPLGAGSLQVDITSTLPYGTYFMAITFHAGLYPYGWFAGGLDIPLDELFAEYSAGFPFVGSLDSCGATTIGPFTGLTGLSGIPFYSVTLGTPAGGGPPVLHGGPLSASIL